MSVTVTRTKILVPKRRSDLLSRSRLICVLDDVLDYPYTLISAPAGYGKTSLMIDLAHQANYPFCWYSIDPLDLDPNRFLTHFIHAIQIQFPDFGGATLSLLDDQTNLLQDPAQVVSILVNEIYQKISEHFVLFIDDYHHLNSDQGICSFISRFGQKMDDNTHLVMASRTLFDFPDLPLLIGRRMVKGIGFDELAFQSREIKSYYREILQRDITHEETETLLDRTEGWITGLVFSGDTDLTCLPGSGKKGRIAGADLFQYLVEQVLEQQPLPIQDFLMRSSLFDEFNADFCELVLGQSTSDSWTETISVLIQKNLFIQQVEDDNSWIRYHSLFRDFLRARFHDRYPEDEKKIYSRLLAIYQESESWEKAFAIASQIGSPELMADVIDRAYSSLIHQGRMKLLYSWLELLPEEGFRSLPWLYLLHGAALTELGKPLQGQSKINFALEHQVDDSADFHIMALTWRATSNRILGKYKEALADSKRAINLSQADSISNPLIAEAYREIGIANGRLGNNSDSIKNLKNSLNEYRQVSKIRNVAQVQIDLGHAYMQVGNYKNAKQQFEESLAYWILCDNKNKLSILNNNLGYLAILNGDYYKANTFLSKALTYAKESSNKRLQALALASIGDLTLSIKLLNNSLSNFENSKIISDQIKEGYLLSYLSLHRAIIYRYLGELLLAADNLKIAHTFILQGGSQNELGLWHLEMGFLNLALNEHRSSRESFLLAESIFELAEKPLDLAKARMGLVLASHELAKPRLVQRHIKDWKDSLAQLETNQPLLPELHYQAQEINDALKDTPPNPALDTLLADLDTYRKRLPRMQKEIFPDQARDQLSAYKLEINALGRNQVFSKGNKVTSPEWIYQKTVRELFFYLLTLPRGATKEQIGLVFWPDSSPSQLTCQFKNAIYRMRRAIGRDAILYDPEARTYSFNMDQQYSYDVEDFLSVFQKAEKEHRIAERANYFQEAVDLYNHPYSPQMGGVWAEPIRQSLSRKYEQALLVVVKYKLDQNQNRACINYCQMVLEIDSCHEKAYQYCMKAYANLTDRNGILRIYTECVNKLNSIYEIEPSLETIRLYERLIE